ncbi:uncharacterized protein FOMMEDRAFT_164999 [Fomitiporia mediterranea MF3/22]|uniref:uncharacterized protein n=1 Tax=Fomitiporia mediterranea (strain MF3/22) TaxID=694068 RepID=UPI0004407C17|nr:uncharacterized protein FOMMEDRAFT_164999 [Fomitiporia mediterranea MF3/22]EJD08387.1 hypothetical protein FOMMEDRAFT_164999 [Fomitiporia mediterranea MF3/22]
MTSRHMLFIRQLANRLLLKTPYMTADDINIGIGAILETVEMTIFAFLHIKAFSYKPYVQTPDPLLAKTAAFTQDDVVRTPRWRSLGHAFDFRETFRELWDGLMYIVRRSRGTETDTMARRMAIREDVFSVSNHSRRGHPHRTVSDSHSKPDEKYKYQPVSVSIDVEKEVLIDSERQWIGTGDDYIYGLGFSRRERSAGLAEQIETELEQRGITTPFSRTLTTSSKPNKKTKSGKKRRRSLWRKALDRISRTSTGAEERGNAATTDRRERSRDGYTEYNPIPIAEEDSELPVSSSSMDNQVSHHQHSPPVPNSSHSPHLYPSRNSDLPPSPKPISVQESISGGLFSNKPSSESSGPTSQTHPSSRGNHVRLTAPAPVVSSHNLRAPTHQATLVHSIDCPGLLPSSGEFGYLRSMPAGESDSDMPNHAPRVRTLDQGTVDGNGDYTGRERRSSHRREHAHHERLYNVVTWSARQSMSPPRITSSSSRSPLSRHPVNVSSPQTRGRAGRISLSHGPRQIVLPVLLGGTDASPVSPTLLPVENIRTANTYSRASRSASVLNNQHAYPSQSRRFDMCEDTIVE